MPPEKTKTKKALYSVLHVILALLVIPICFALILATQVYGVLGIILFVILWNSYSHLITMPGMPYYKLKTFSKWLIFIVIDLIFSILIALTLVSWAFESSNSVCSSHHTTLPDFTIYLIAGILFIIILSLAIKFKKNIAKIFKILLIMSTLIILMMGYFALETDRRKGCEAAIKAHISNFRTTAVSYFDTYGNYGSTASGENGCTTGTMFIDKTLSPTSLKETSYLKNIDMVCNSSGADYAVSANLPITKKWWCIDSAGTSLEISKPLTTELACPKN